jgi:Ribose/xylose/arabinose/galactoside ABC-type transport systems, permease components
MKASTLLLYCRQIADISFAVLGSMAFLMAGEINLASGGQVYLGYAVLGLFCGRLGLGTGLGIALLIAVSLGIGGIHFFLRNRLGIATIYSSIALQVVFGGVAGLVLAPRSSLSADILSPSFLPERWSRYGWIIVWVASLAIVEAVLNFSSHGRGLPLARALRGSPAAGREASRITGFAMLFGSVLISLSSIFLFSKLSGSPISLSPGYTYDVLVGTFLGGVGRWRSRNILFHAILGASAVTLLNAVLLLSGLSTAMETLIKGSIILFGCYFAAFSGRPQIPSRMITRR